MTTMTESRVRRFAREYITEPSAAGKNRAMEWGEAWLIASGFSPEKAHKAFMLLALSAAVEIGKGA